MPDLEKQFHAAMLDIYERAKLECDYNATYFIRMVYELGGLRAAKRLLATADPSSGLTRLWQCGRLDLSVEAHALKPEFDGLFTDEEKVIAHSRLHDYGYEIGTEQR